MTVGSEPGRSPDTEPLGGLPRPELLHSPEHQAHKAALAARLFGQAPLVVRVGRFRVGERLGEGGMGVVYAGDDEELGRRVAIKLLHAGAEEGGGAPRLLREAQALARLSHPNVVQLFEVGQHQGRLFVAMELVRGQTLHAWMHAGPRSWREVLAVFIPAGRGLAAAHAVGLVHRDFKPSNVMLADDGGVRVLDFGLARAGTEEEVGAGGSVASETLLATALTQTGGLVGTPAYMAPEQFHGRSSDPRGDQFSFCVALFEALYGMRPFAGATHAELLVAIDRGAIARAPSGSRVPRWLHAVVSRGLARAPERRWPTMTALLAELGRDRQARRRRLALAGVFAGLAALPIALGVSAGREYLEQRERVAACELRGEEIAEVWNPTARARLRDVLLADATPKQRRAVEQALGSLDERASRWRTRRIDGCLMQPEGYVHPVHMAERVARMDSCFAETRDDLATLIGVVERGPRAWLGALGRVEFFAGSRCTGEAWLTATTASYPESPAARRHWQAIRAPMLAGELAVVAGQPVEGEALLRPAIRGARGLPTARIATDGLRTLCSAEFAAGRRRQGFATLASGLARGGEFLRGAGFDLHDPLELQLLLGAATGKPRYSAALMLAGREAGMPFIEAESLAPALARAAAPFWRTDWIGIDSQLGRNMLQQTAVSSLLLTAVGDFEAAEEYTRMGRHVAAAQPEIPAVTVDLLLALAAVHTNFSRFAAAEEALGEARVRAESGERAAGSRRGAVRLALAELELARGDAEAAARELAAATGLLPETERDDDRFVPALTLLQGRLALHRGEYERAGLLLERARASLVDSHGAARRLLVASEVELAAVAQAQDRLADAEELLGAALRHNELLVGPEHVSHAAILVRLAELQRARGEAAAAEASRGRGRSLIAKRTVAPELRAALGR